MFQRSVSAFCCDMQHSKSLESNIDSKFQQFGQKPRNLFRRLSSSRVYSSFFEVAHDYKLIVRLSCSL